MFMKALIVYGTRYGWTQKTAAVMESALKGKGYSVDLSTGRLPKGCKSVEDYDLVIAGSSIAIAMWKWGVKGFLKRQGGKAKKLYVFVTAAGVLNSIGKEGKTKEQAIESAKKAYIEPVQKKYGLSIIGTAVFGGQYGKGEKIHYNNWDEKDIVNWIEEITK